MYYKVINKDSEIYQKLYQFRQNEVLINEKNKKAIEEKFGSSFATFLGQTAQQTFERVPTYLGFEFINPENVDLNAWKRDKEFPQIYVPNKKTKLGREADRFLSRLEVSSCFDLMSIFNVELEGRSFTIPYLEIFGDVLLVYLDDKQELKDEKCNRNN